MKVGFFQIFFMLILMFIITLMLWLEQKRIKVYKNDKRVVLKRNQTYVRVFHYAVLLLIFIVFFALREIDEGIGGIDAIVYKIRFLNATGNVVEGIKSQDNEIGFGLFVYIVRLFTSNYKVFQIIYYIILLLLLINVNKNIIKTKASFFLTWIFLTLNIFLSVCLVRNVMAYFLAFNAIAFAENSKRGKSIICCILSVLFHYSTIILLYGFFIYWLLAKLKFSNKKIIFTLIFNVLVVIVFGRRILGLLSGSRYAIYTDSSAFAFGQLARYGLLAIVYYFVYKKIYKNAKRENLINKSHVQAVSIIFPIQLYFPIAYRMYDVSGYSLLQVWNSIGLCGKKVMKYLSVGCFVILFLELYLFITETIPAYGILLI